MEGKEVRFGIAASALFATVTTDASCGAVNSMHDSFTPLGGLVPLFNMLTGEVIFGGVGAGLYGMLMFAVLAVFIAGLMVGRTPEYLGKKIEKFEVQMAMLAMLVLCGERARLHRRCSSVIDLPKEGALAALNTWPGSAYGGSDSGVRRRDRQPEQRRAARLQRDLLRVRLGHRQQRLRVRRPHRQHAVLQHSRSASRC